jgi:hypothetical protein
MREHLAARHILQHHIQIGRVLERVDELDHKGKVNRAQDLLFVESMLDLFHFDDVLFFEHFHGVALSSIAFDVHDHDTAKGARAYGPVEIEIVETTVFAVDYLLLLLLLAFFDRLR